MSEGTSHLLLARCQRGGGVGCGRVYHAQLYAVELGPEGALGGAGGGVGWFVGGGLNGHSSPLTHTTFYAW